MSIRAVRGAITAENTKESIWENTRIMLEEMMGKNSIDIKDIISVVFTCTSDLTKAYPAVAAREIGITDASLMCLQELYVEGSLEKCIRVMVSIESDAPQSEIKHVYLKEAARLRPDIAD